MNQAVSYQNQDLVSLLCDFLETAIHVVLHEKLVYPKTAFQRQKAWQAEFPICRHPAVAQHIASVVAGLKVCIIGRGGHMHSMQNSCS